ncbi:MAG: nicotinate-nucleotide adenylyltransferase [Paludibacteraceae bacterium]|nr:nicotinate-nucleotide adenylyltransferase [Paludibacteraceae bacterium]
MKQVGIFSGSFNPVHLGHVLLAQTICREAALDEVWLVVSPQNPLKQQADLADEQQRLQMTRIAVRGIQCLKASDAEFTMPRPSYTWNTLSSLRSQHPRTRYHLIIGSDNAALFDQWRNYQDILANFPIIVYPREGDDMQAVTARYPMMRVIQAPLLPISSTQIRNMLRQGQDTSQWLHPRVLQYIRLHGLYLQM